MGGLYDGFPWGDRRVFPGAEGGPNATEWASSLGTILNSVLLSLDHFEGIVLHTCQPLRTVIGKQFHLLRTSFDAFPSIFCLM